MNAALLTVLVLVLFVLGYRFYSGFLTHKVFRLSADEPVPSREFEDGIDFVPTRASVLWGHHFTSIAGAAPIVGPALAVIWGWVPALIWVVVGTIAMGAVHDFSALVISLRNEGRSIGDITGDVIGARARTFFMLIIVVLIWIVLAVFAFIIGTLFVAYPAAIFPINVQIIVAMTLGWLVYRKGVPILLPSLVAFALLMVAVFYGQAFADAFPALTEITVSGWVWILLIYSFFASVLPVWLLLQPRDYLNSHQLVTGLFLLIAGLFVLRPTIVAPAFNLDVEGSPPVLPFLFITIACGAISGFHGLVSSGTTSKQIGCMTDARPIGYGGMLGEGTLALLAVMATTAGFATRAEWSVHYSSWGAAGSLTKKLEAFVNGGARFISELGIPTEIAATFIAVMVVAFAATTLDTGARILRMLITELSTSVGFKPLQNRFAAGGLGVAAALILAITQAGGQGGLALWPLFGTTNQLTAAATLLVVSLWLRSRQAPFLYTLVPAGFVGVVTVIAMTREVYTYAKSGNILLLVLGAVILLLDLWVMVEGFRLFSKPARAPASASA